MAVDTNTSLANGTNHVNGKLVAPSSIAHFGIRTRPENFEKMVEWHCNFFGGTVFHKTDVAAFIRWDHVRILKLFPSISYSGD